MKQFSAIFWSQGGKALLGLPLVARTIQEAIDEAKGVLSGKGGAERFGASSLDIFVDGMKVETVGLGADPYRT